MHTLLLLWVATGVRGTEDSLAIKRYTIKPAESVKLVYEGDIRDANFRHGSFTMYYRERKVASGYYYNNEKQGKWLRYFPNGKVRSEAYYIQGRKHGRWKYFLPSGQLSAETNFVNDIKTGSWRGYYDDGTPACIYNYENDRLVGEFVLYHPNGRIAQNTRIRYQDTNLLVHETRYYNTGQIYEDS
ncbi:MAG: toxin-antitoxin system YwqK family antitoxin, partial [Bacteroidota bacterium]